MSFVGPRPLRVDYLPLYNKEQRHRHDIRPGLTGLAQVSGRNNITWSEKFKYDLDYISNITFLNDLKITLLTIEKVVLRKDIYSNNKEFSEKFTGDN